MIDEKAHGAPAAIIVEPIQGTAGNLLPPGRFLGEVRALATRAGALLIADEMITGFGRTGLMFGCEYDGVTPDIMTVGKGMASGFPISAVISTNEIVAAEPFSLPSASSSSYGGNPLACAAALATIMTIRDDRLVENAARIGRLLLDGLRELEARHPSIRNVRGRGLLIGFDLVESAAAGGDFEVPFLRKDRCVAFFKELRKRGIRVVIITNALEATDVAAVHAGYRRYRKALLYAGCELYEFKASASLSESHKKSDTGTSGSSGASLHAKTFVFDEKYT